MADKLVIAFASILTIFLVSALGFMVQGLVIKVDRRKGGWESGNLLKKIGWIILIFAGITAFIAAILGARSEVTQFCVAASVGGVNVLINSRYLLEDDRQNFGKALRDNARFMGILAVVSLAAMIISWAFAVDP